ncbi:MAG: hypothetical protein ACRDJM_01445, partial [Actinomycetota bacterium]
MIRFLAALIEDRRLAVATAGALAIIAGSAAPWAHVASPLRALTELGLDANGKITILCGALALGLVAAYARLRQRDLAVSATALSVVAAALATVYLIDLRRASGRVVQRVLEAGVTSRDVDFAARAGAGLWAT